jgi:hypothetical protein
MGLFSGIASCFDSLFSSSSLADTPTSSSSDHDGFGSVDCPPMMNEQSSGSSNSIDTSDVFSAWGTATPNQVASESGSCSLFHGNSFTETTYGSIDSGSSSSFDGGSSFSSSSSFDSWT